MNIYQKLVEVRKMVPYLQKESTGPQYKYTGSSQVLAAVRAKMDELGLILEPAVIGHKVTTHEKPNAKGGTTNEYFTELDMEFTWVNAENPEEKITKPWYGQGIDTAGEKGVGKAMTYAEKYFILKYFNIATDKDDPDAFQAKHDNNNDAPQKQQEQPQNKPNNQPSNLVSEAQAKAIHAKANELAKLMNTTKDSIFNSLAHEFYLGPFQSVETLDKQRGSKAIELLNGWIKTRKEQPQQ